MKRRKTTNETDEIEEVVDTVATRISKMRHEQGTLDGYAGKINRIKVFMLGTNNLHECIDDAGISSMHSCKIVHIYTTVYQLL